MCQQHYGGLNDNGTHRFIYLNVLFPAGGAVRGKIRRHGLGDGFKILPQVQSPSLPRTFRSGYKLSATAPALRLSAFHGHAHHGLTL